jgi:hypothetical protein
VGVRAGRRSGRLVALCRKGKKKGSPTKFGGKIDGTLTFPLLITFPPFQVQVRKAAIASCEV